MVRRPDTLIAVVGLPADAFDLDQVTGDAVIRYADGSGTG